MEEYTLEHLNLDLKKVNLYVENAVAAFNITVDETAMMESATESDLILTEAGDGLGIKIKMAIAKIIESIKKFFANLINKIKGIFNKNTEDGVKKALKNNPDAGKVKIDITNIKKIENYCGKRFALRARLIKKCKAGTLTQDEFDQIVAQHDELGAKMKKVGVISATVLAAAGAVFGGVAIVKKVASNGKGAVDDTKGLEKGGQTGVAVGNLNAKGTSEDNKTMVEGKTSILKKIITAIKGFGGKIAGKFRKTSYTSHDTITFDSKSKRIYKNAADEWTDAVNSGLSGYDTNSVDDFDFDLSDTFFDI